jgi:DNA-binding CsgD family transcriptional regulator
VAAEAVGTEPMKPGDAWPLLGRDSELSQVGACFDSGQRGVIFVGAVGVGKTRLALECLRLATERGFAQLQVASTEAMSSLPLGQFATLLPEIAPATPRTEAFRQIALAIRARGDDRPVALLVDDIHLLDEASAALTLQLAANSDVFLIATMRATEPAPESVITLWKNEIVTRIDLRPLDYEVMGQLLERILGGPLEAPARRQLLDRSAGNVLFLRELVTGAVDDGALKREAGLWHLEGNLAASTRLVELVEARLAQLDDDERTGLEIVALGEPLGIGAFQRLVPSAVIRSLERRHLLEGHRDGRRLDLRLSHPMYAEVLRAMLSSTKARSLYGELADTVVGCGARRQADLLNLALWRLESGGTVDPQAMIKAAHRAWMLHDFVLASDLGSAASRAGGGFDADLLVAQVLATSGRADEAKAMMEALVPRAASDDQRTRLATARIENLCYQLLAPEEALLIAEEAEATILDPVCKQELAAFRATLSDTRGETTALLAVAELGEHGSGRAQAWACLMASSGFARVGRFADALVATERAFSVHSALTEPGLPFGPDLHTAVRAWVFTLQGDLAAAEEIAAGAVAAGEWISGWPIAATYLARGRAATAARWARETTVIARRFGQTMVLKIAFTPLVEALALTGELTAADEVLEVLRGDRMRAVQIFEAEASRVHGWVELIRGNRSRAKALFEEAIAIAAETGDAVFESVALHDLARVDVRAANLERLERLAATIEGPLVQGRLAHVRSSATSDPDGLSEVSVDFEQLGCILLAAEAAADSALAWRRAGRLRQATAAERRAAELAERCEGATPALAADLGARVTLAPRQLEIASLAARGVPNKTIARQLGLSLRTVENRLHETYHLLGITGRDELAETLEALKKTE